MWDNPRLLNMAAGALTGIAALAFLVAGTFLLLSSELFPMREVQVKTALHKTTKIEIEVAIQSRIGGNFFATSPAELRLGLEKLPWVRRASVRKVWPDRVELELEEHVALARWGDDALINIYGEKFPGKTSQVLPLFVGPAGSEREVASRYARFAELAAPLGSPLERVVLTPRFAWQLRLASGLNIMLGRDADSAELRLARFVAAYPETLGRIARRHAYVDLRYANGFALRAPELRG